MLIEDQSAWIDGSRQCYHARMHQRLTHRLILNQVVITPHNLPSLDCLQLSVFFFFIKNQNEGS